MFSVSICGKCGGRSFKGVEQSITDGAFKMTFVQCSSCDVPIGVSGYYDAGFLIKKQEGEMEKLQQQVSGLEHNLRQMFAMLQNLQR